MEASKPVDEATLFTALLNINGELAALREEVRVGFAALPSQYVSQKSVTEAKREALVAKRFAVSAAIMSLGVFSTFVASLF